VNPIEFKTWIKTHLDRIDLAGILTIVGVIAWTLVPNSHSLMVVWPGVLFWQVVVVLPLIWLWFLGFGIGRKPRYSLSHFALGGGLDWLMGAGVGVIILNTIASSCREFSLWYGLAACGGMGAVYALHRLQKTQLLWELQGWVGIVFSLESLALWWFNVYQPEHQRLESLQDQYGISLSFNFNQLELQNWYPLGHQNYVAGYLVLTLPLLVGLWVQAFFQTKTQAKIQDKNHSKQWRCWLWGIGIVVQLLDLYTTHSRGGTLAILGILCGGLFIMAFLYPLRVILPVLGGGIAVIIAGIWSNDRLRSFILAMLQGKVENSQLTYRFITNTIGWSMGISDPWTGLGLGSVPLLYQAYHPRWAGQDAELHYQLHSTPAQLWAELGIGGITIALGLMGLILFHFLRWLKTSKASENLDLSEPNSGLKSSSILVWSSAASLLGYSLMALTDYQLDTIAISGTFILCLVLFWRSVLPPPASFSDPIIPPQPLSFHRFLSLGSVGVGLALFLWLIPVHRAWATAHKGFEALGNDRKDEFIQAVSKAHNLAPWEPYYAWQLGWNLGEFSTQVTDPQESAHFRENAIQWFEIGTNSAPDQEFGHSNLGWLFLQNGQPQKASLEFEKAVQLLPAKEGLWFALGLSELLDNQPTKAIDRFGQELLRHPLTMINPLWQTEPLKSIQNQVFDRLDQFCTQGLEDSSSTDPELLTYLHNIRGVARWWRGDFSGAETDWQSTSFSLGLALLDLEKTPEQMSLDTLTDSATQLLLKAWQAENGQNQGEHWLIQAWQSSLTQNQGFPPLSLSTVRESLREAKAQNRSLRDWLGDVQHYQSYRPDRLGFGVLSRHLGGSIPKDYGLRYDNLLINHFLSDLFPERSYFPALDLKLEQFRSE
jgi:tetratricopeptide (TPR) repeat protein